MFEKTKKVTINENLSTKEECDLIKQHFPSVTNLIFTASCTVADIERYLNVFTGVELSILMERTSLDQFARILDKNPAFFDVDIKIDGNIKEINLLNFDKNYKIYKKLLSSNPEVKKIIIDIKNFFDLISYSEYFYTYFFKFKEEIDFYEEEISSDMVEKILEKFPNLKKITCKSAVLDLRNKQYSESKILRLMNFSRDYKKIFFDKNQFSDNIKEPLIYYDKCVEIDFSDNFVEEKFLLKVLNNCKNIKKISHNKTKLIFENCAVTSKNLSILIESVSDQLSSLSIKNCIYFYEDSFFGRDWFSFDFKSLSSFVVEDIAFPNGEIDAMIKNSPVLASLTLSYPILSRSDFMYISKNLLIENIKNIYLINVKNKKELILNQVRNLENYELSHSTIYFDEPLLDSVCETILEFHLIKTKISAVQLLDFFKKCPNLCKIEFLGAIIDGDKSELSAFLNKFSKKHTFITDVIFFENKNKEKNVNSKVLYKGFFSDSTQITNFIKSKKEDTAESITLDANTDPGMKKTFNVSRVFYAMKSMHHPDPAQYRLKIFNEIQINPNECLDTEAFFLEKKDDLNLESRDIVFSASDVYEEAAKKNKTLAAQCFYAKTRLLLSNTWQSLPSLSSTERLSHIHLDPSVEVEIQYSLCDNLYYVRSVKGDLKKEITIDYLLEVYEPKKNPTHDVKKLIAFCKHFSAKKLKMLTYAAPTGVDFLLEIVRQKVGACRHRSAVFMALLQNPQWREKIPKLRKLDLKDIDARIVNNDVHSYVEVKENGIWIKYDLGGYPANVNTKDEFNPLSKKVPIKKPEELTIEKKISREETEALLKEVQNLKTLSFESEAPLGILMREDLLEDISFLNLGETTLTPNEFIEIVNKAKNLKKISFDSCVLSKNLPVYTFSDEKKSLNQVVPLADIREYFSQVRQEEVEEVAIYVQRLTSTETSKILIECQLEQILGLSYQLQLYYQKTQHSYQVIQSPADLVLRKPYLELQQDWSGRIKKGLNGDVYRFLLRDEKSRTLIVNFANFSASDLARYNALLDDEPSIDGVVLPLGTKVIGLIDRSHEKDASLYSRFDSSIEACGIEAATLAAPSPFVSLKSIADPDESLTIRFYGAPNWKAKLLGSWCLLGEHLQFSCSEFITLLEKGQAPQQLILNNPPLTDPEFILFFQEANLKGYIEYEGRTLPWPKMTIATTYALTFLNEQISDINYGIPNADSLVINPNTFSKFIKQYHFLEDENHSGKLFETDGLLAEYAEKQDSNSSICLYVTENLSVNQWAQLLDASQHYGLKLSVRLADIVNIPLEIAKAFDIEPIAEKKLLMPALMPLKEDYAIASTDRDISIAHLQSEHKNALYIDVSELYSSDLLLKIGGELADNDSPSFVFTREEGALLKALNSSKTVVLHGNFSVEMRQRLQAFLWERKKLADNNGQVIIVSDDKTINTFENILPLTQHAITPIEKEAARQAYAEKIVLQLIHYDHSNDTVEQKNRLLSGYLQRIAFDQIAIDLPYVTQQAMIRHQVLLANEKDAWVGLKTDLPVLSQETVFDLSTAEAQTIALNDTRFSRVASALSVSPFVFLAGMSGVGKTTFVEKIWQDKAAGRTLHVGEKKLYEWAMDRSPGIKMLFLDEANITRNNWTQFEGMFSNTPIGIMIGNQYIELTNEHKIIFAGNPVTYSDDRTLPILFERHGNSLVFEPLSPAYIFHEMLQPIFKGEDARFSEVICEPILKLNQYLEKLSRNEILLTPRELVMMAQLSLNFAKQHPTISVEKIAQYYAWQLSRQFVPESHLKKFDEAFSIAHPQEASLILSKNGLTLTDANQSTARMLMGFLMLRKATIEAATTSSAPGLGGMTLEGEPGLGKSELVIACLKAHGFEKRSLDATNTPIDQQYFYHLPAAANPKIKREILERAFHEGAVVVCDEINTAASLENLLNRLLMGKGPSGEDPKKPGFMFIGTQNPTTMAGRIKTSTALLHRMHYRVIPPYTTDEMKLILREMGLPERRIHHLVMQYQSASKTNKTLCFRNVVVSAKEDLKGLLGKFSKEMTVSDLLKLVENKESNAEVLEAVYRHRLCDDRIWLAIANHSQASSELLDLLVSKNSYYDSFQESILKNPNTSVETLISIAEKCKNENDYLTIIDHPSVNSDIIDYLLKNTTSIPIVEKIIDNHDLTSVQLSHIVINAGSSDILEKIAHLRNLDSSVMIELMRRESRIAIIHAILSHPNCNESVLFEAIARHDDRHILLATLWHKKVSEKFLITVLKKTNDNFIQNVIFLHEKCSEEMLSEILSDASSNQHSIFLSIAQKTTDNALLFEIAKKTTDISVLIEVCKKAKDKKMLEFVVEHVKFPENMNDDSGRIDFDLTVNLFQEIVNKILTMNKSLFIERYYDVFHAIISKIVSINHDGILDLNNAINELVVKIVPFLREEVVLSLIDHFKKNKKILDTIYHASFDKSFSKTVNVKLIKLSNAATFLEDYRMNQKTLKNIIENKNLYKDLSSHVNHRFFSKKPSLELYPLSVVMAGLILIEMHYKGMHKTVLSGLIRKTMAFSAVSMIIGEIDKLVDSGVIGRMWWSGKLRNALVALSDTVKKGERLDVDSLLKHFPDQTVAPRL